MARIRTIKPEFFDDPKMADVSPLARLTFIGLWTQVDKAGRILYEPKRLKVRILPFDDCDVEAVVAELVRIGVVTVYESDDRKVLQVNAFLKHQRPHPREPESDLPDRATSKPVPAVKENGQPLQGNAEPVRKGREGNGREQEGNGEAGESDTPFTSPAEPPSHPFSRWLTEWHAAYPKSRQVAVRAIERPFVSAFFRHNVDPPELFGLMMAALESHKASEEWQRNVIPGMGKWLNEDWWLRVLTPAKAGPQGKPQPDRMAFLKSQEVA